MSDDETSGNNASINSSFQDKPNTIPARVRVVRTSQFCGPEAWEDSSGRCSPVEQSRAEQSRVLRSVEHSYRIRSRQFIVTRVASARGE